MFLFTIFTNNDNNIINVITLSSLLSFILKNIVNRKIITHAIKMNKKLNKDIKYTNNDNAEKNGYYITSAY